MSHLELALKGRLRAAIEAAFGPEHKDTDPLLRRSDRADFQANVAMSLGKVLRRAPREVAQALVERLELGGVCEKAEIAGPGFINLTVSAEALADSVAQMASDLKLGVPPRDKPDVVVIDYGGPNIAKEMHVGHLRSAIIGDSLARVLEFCGQHVLRQNHIGDWGTPFGMLIEHLIDVKRESNASELSIGELGDFYRAARAKFDANPEFADRSRARVVSLQAGDAATLELWRTFVQSSKRYMEAVFERLSVKLTDADVRGESFFNDQLASVADELEARGLASLNDGALCIFPPGFQSREGEPLPLILRKQDGGFGYAATDLAAIRFRVGTLRGTRLLYVVSAQQQQHFAMVFEAAKMAGFLPSTVRAEHVAFGNVLGDDRKILKSRAGYALRLIDLLDEAVARAERAIAEKNPELNSEECALVARQVGIGAVKYADLSSDRNKDYVFEWERMLAFEGNTGPYLQYAHARIRSIFRKAGQNAPGALKITEPVERALCLELLSFARVLSDVEELLQPHKLCGYLYELAARFTSFYDACPVLKAADAQRASRLALCELTARTLATGLNLLGIAAPERM
ncbi:MAG TPA: arginine--tRNA ligase [Polyangiaceae bacterium]|jgi:arginyl-tRNA synthetase